MAVVDDFAVVTTEAVRACARQLVAVAGCLVHAEVVVAVLDVTEASEWILKESRLAVAPEVFKIAHKIYE